MSSLYWVRWVTITSSILIHSWCFAQYFQQRVDHVIQVQLNDRTHELDAQQSFTYHNNAPIALDTIWMHLWPNAYSEDHSALCKQMDEMDDFSLHFAKEKDRGHIDSLNFSLGPHPLPWGYHPAHKDIAWIKLPMPLASGTFVTISTAFHVKVPSGRFSRLGHTDQAYYITQWYPKPAVYDKDGWHTMPYLTQGEFYSEFGRFEVKITLPKNYVVGATGELQEMEEQRWLAELASLRHEEVGDEAAAKDEKLNAFPPSSPETKTITYIQEDVHDFAWFADKRFIVKKGSAYLARSDREVSTWVMYTPKNSKTWKDALSYVDKSVQLYSEWCGDYPYSNCTAIDGTISAGGGMEYPMITIIGNAIGPMTLDNVIAHEVGHNWFYGILANNERDHPWMDEGMNSFVEMRYMDAQYPDNPMGMGVPLLGALTKDQKPFHRLQTELSYRLNARRNLDQSADLHSTEYTSTNYGVMVYSKTALAFDQLFDFLGPERFDACMQTYYSTWKFKHPSPADVRATFEQVSGEDLGWFFDDLLGTTKKVDLKAVKLRGNQFTYRASAPDSMPVPITGIKGETISGTEWTQAEQERTTVELPWADAENVVLDKGERTLDIDHRNNSISGVHPRLKFLTGLENPKYRDTYWTPALAWGAADGLMLGAVVHNHGFPSKRNEFVLAPMYGSLSNELAGGARFMHHMDRLDSRMFQNIHWGVSARRATAFYRDDLRLMYSKVTPEITFDLRPRHLHRSPKQSIQVRYIWSQDDIRIDQEAVTRATQERYGQELRYRIERKIGLTPWSVTLTGQGHQEQTMNTIRAFVEAKGSALFDEDGHRATLRLFVGKIFEHGLGSAAWHTSGVTGQNDLFYDYVLPGRTETQGLAAQHFYADQGGFKTPTALGRSTDLLASLNFKVDVPFTLPLMVFASTSLAPVTVVTQVRKTTTYEALYEVGIGIRVIRDVFEIWVPLSYSQKIKDEFEFLGRDFTDQIRFTLALDKLDPTRLLRNLAP